MRGNCRSARAIPARDGGGAPFSIDADQYERWNRPAFVLDIAPSAPEGFSLGLGDTHFVTRTAVLEQDT